MAFNVRRWTASLPPPAVQTTSRWSQVLAESNRPSLRLGLLLALQRHALALLLHLHLLDGVLPLQVLLARRRIVIQTQALQLTRRHFFWRLKPLLPLLQRPLEVTPPEEATTQHTVACRRAPRRQSCKRTRLPRGVMGR